MKEFINCTSMGYFMAKNSFIVEAAFKLFLVFNFIYVLFNASLDIKKISR